MLIFFFFLYRNQHNFESLINKRKKSEEEERYDIKEENEQSIINVKTEATCDFEFQLIDIDDSANDQVIEVDNSLNEMEFAEEHLENSSDELESSPDPNIELKSAQPVVISKINNSNARFKRSFKKILPNKNILSTTKEYRKETKLEHISPMKPNQNVIPINLIQIEQLQTYSNSIKRIKKDNDESETSNLCEDTKSIGRLMNSSENIDLMKVIPGQSQPRSNLKSFIKHQQVFDSDILELNYIEPNSNELNSEEIVFEHEESLSSFKSTNGSSRNVINNNQLVREEVSDDHNYNVHQELSTIYSKFADEEFGYGMHIAQQLRSLPCYQREQLRNKIDNLIYKTKMSVGKS